MYWEDIMNENKTNPFLYFGIAILAIAIMIVITILF